MAFLIKTNYYQISKNCLNLSQQQHLTLKGGTLVSVSASDNANTSNAVIKIKCHSLSGFFPVFKFVNTMVVIL